MEERLRAGGEAERQDGTSSMAHYLLVLTSHCESLGWRRTSGGKAAVNQWRLKLRVVTKKDSGCGRPSDPGSFLVPGGMFLSCSKKDHPNFLV